MSVSWHTRPDQARDHGGISAVPTNEQRRTNAKRKLQRQLKRRALQARRRRTQAMVVGIVSAEVVVASILFSDIKTNQDHTINNNNNKQASASGSSSTTATSGPVSGAALP